MSTLKWMCHLCGRLCLPIFSVSEFFIILQLVLNVRDEYVLSLTWLHSPSKCLAWVKKCCHVWLDQNFDPSLLTNKLWLIFMGKKQKKIFFLKKKIQNGRLKKSAFFKIANSQNFFVKISWIGPWVSRIDWCEGHWFISTYMAVRLSDIRAKTA